MPENELSLKLVNNKNNDELLLMSEGIDPVLEEKHVDQFVEPVKTLVVYKAYFSETENIDIQSSMFKITFENLDSLSIDFSKNVSLSFRGTSSIADMLNANLTETTICSLYENDKLIVQLNNISISCNSLEPNLSFFMLSGKKCTDTK